MPPPEGATAQTVERVFREEYGRGRTATLIRVFGDFDLAEDALQEAFIAAADHWPAVGVPDSPAAWLTTAARNKALSRLHPSRPGPARKTNRSGASCETSRRQTMETPTQPDERFELLFTAATRRWDRRRKWH